MVRMVQSRIAAGDAARRDDLAKAVKALSAEAALPYQAALDEVDRDEIAEGVALLASRVDQLHRVSRVPGNGRAEHPTQPPQIVPQPLHQRRLPRTLW